MQHDRTPSHRPSIPDLDRLAATSSARDDFTVEPVWVVLGMVILIVETAVGPIVTVLLAALGGLVLLVVVSARVPSSASGRGRSGGAQRGDDDGGPRRPGPPPGVGPLV